jgi:hypothetical protein
VLKIKYPKNLREFKEDYLKIFNIIELEKEWNDYKKNYNIQNANFSIVKLLIEDFKYIYIKSQKIIYNITDKEFNELKKIFNYSKYQPKIADFFMKYKDELNLATCYYCNIDYINVFFNSKKYFTPLDFLNNSNLLELEQVVGKNKANILIKKRDFYIIEEILNIKGIGNITKNNLENYQQNLDMSNHFTLDHIIDKAKNPIVALSLFNFVPSCYSCNSKFKKSQQFVNNISQVYKSPTHKEFDFNQVMKFKLFYIENIFTTNINNIDDFKVELVRDLYNHSYKDYIDIFKLNERYEFHKDKAFELIVKNNEYPSEYIQNIANIVGKSEIEIKKDIFGSEVFIGDLGDVPLSKLKRDVCKSVGVL